MPWIQNEEYEYIWFGKGKTRIEGKEGYETLSLDAKQYETIIYHMKKRGLLKDKEKREICYWHFPNNEEVEINPKNYGVTFKKNSSRTSVRTRLERIIGIEHTEVGH